jgi:mono/diheme cytochrome c family protein
VTGDEKILTNILLHGINGEIEVNGKLYKGVMPAWGMLTDDEIAGVISYIRSDWGNASPPVTSATVKSLRISKVLMKVVGHLKKVRNRIICAK